MAAAARLFVWGSGGAGQLGLGDTNDYALPQQASGISDDQNKIVLDSITCGGCHSAGIGATGELFVWGDNAKQQLGLDAAQQQREATAPTQVALADAQRRVRLVACGWSHTLAVCSTRALAASDASDDVVFAWGAHEHHQLGRPVQITESRKQLAAAIPRFHIARPLRVKSLACGWKHSLLCTETGEVFAWGSGRSGELGLGDSVLTADRPELVRIAGVSDNGIDSMSVQKVLCGWQHSVFLTADHTVFTCGSNRHGQLGHASAASKVNGTPQRVELAPEVSEAAAAAARPLRASQIDVGWHFALCVTAERGELLAWGKGSHGQLGLGEFETATAPMPVPFHPRGGIRDIACGSEHSLVVTNDGELFSCGWGEHGNLGHGDQESRCTLTSIAFFRDERLDVRAVAAGGAVSIALATAQ